MASVIILNSKKRGNKHDRGGAEIERSKSLSSLPQEPWESELVLNVLSGGRWKFFAYGAHLHELDDVSRIFLNKYLFVTYCYLIKFVFRHWARRRVVITRDIMAFAYVGDTNMLDHIPLREITGIENLEQNQQRSSKLLFEKTVNVSNALQIQTIPDGYNSGRKYLIQAENEDERNRLVIDFKRHVKRASIEQISDFQRRQKLVRKIYNSNIVQSFAALLIFMACAANHQPQNTHTEQTKNHDSFHIPIQS
jgi:hypothetical protein